MDHEELVNELVNKLGITDASDAEVLTEEILELIRGYV